MNRIFFFFKKKKKKIRTQFSRKESEIEILIEHFNWFIFSPTRSDSQSQSLSRSYGSILSTSFTYIILSTRGSSPWRPAAVMGTIQCETIRKLNLDFQGLLRWSKHRDKCDALRAKNPISLLKDSRDFFSFLFNGKMIPKILLYHTHAPRTHTCKNIN